MLFRSTGMGASLAAGGQLVIAAFDDNGATLAQGCLLYTSVDAGLSSGMVFDRVGVIDLNWLAGISAICGATGVLLLYFWVKLIRRRAKAAAEQAAQGVEAPEPLQLAAEDPAPEEPEAEQPSEDAPDGEDPPRP